MTKSIFIAVEDKQVFSKVKSLLEKEGFVTDGTDDSLKALNSVRQTRPAMVILEDSLFRLDGFKVCRFLKFDDQFRSIPVLILLSEQRKTEEPLALEVGADAVLIEPFNADNLVMQVRELTKEPEQS